MLPKPKNYSDEDFINYKNLLLKTNSIDRNNDPTSNNPAGNRRGHKWKNLIEPIWHNIQAGKKGKKGSGVIIIPSDRNTLLERLDLLLASQKAGHTGVGNELVSICDELKRQGVLDTNAYKKLNSLIKNDSH